MSAIQAFIDSVSLVELHQTLERRSTMLEDARVEEIFEQNLQEQRGKVAVFTPKLTCFLG